MTDDQLFEVIELFEVIRSSECTACKGMFHPELCHPLRRQHYERHLNLAMTIHRDFVEPLKQARQEAEQEEEHDTESWGIQNKETT